MDTELICQIRDDLKRDEGWVPHVYDDATGEAMHAPHGYATVGFGFLIDERRGDGIPKRVADFWLGYEVQQRYSRLCDELPWLRTKPDPVKRALVNAAYNLGIGGLLSFRKTISLIQCDQYAEAADEMLRSRWAEQVPNRAQRVTDMIRSAA